MSKICINGARAVGHDTRHDMVGIRYDEKLHEQMIASCVAARWLKKDEKTFRDITLPMVRSETKANVCS